MRNMKTATLLALCLCLSGPALSAPPERFASPSLAANALVSAVRAKDIATLRTILGPAGDDIVYSGDSTADDEAGREFLAAYDAHSNVSQRDPMRAYLEVGNDNWVFPIPLVKTRAGWQFDAAAGRSEILARRIGGNELDAIEACLAYVDAQREYASVYRGAGVLEYAQHFVSSNGTHDGLYWEAKPGEAQSPLGPAFAEARAEGYAPRAAGSDVDHSAPFHGYYFKILKAQGPAARGGAYDYVADGRMIGGFALIAYPASYGVSGFTTFTVNQDGIVFQRDLGPGTGKIAPEITQFNPTKAWTKVSESGS
jgi:hypothetical protein